MKLKDRCKKTAALILCLLVLTGCKDGLPIVSDVKDNKNYSLAQSMIIVTTERNRYQQVYGDQIWSVSLDQEETFQTYLLKEVQRFLQDMKTMTLLAENQEVTLTSAEKDRIRRLSQTYYEGLTEDDIRYMGIKQEDVVTMYQEYYLANKVVGELTKELDLEVSDSEAKVISLQQIKLASAETGQQVYEAVTAEGADFAAHAKATSTDPQMDRLLGKGDEAAVFEEAAFALTTGQISPLIEYNGAYYILKCIDDYDETATAERKTLIYEERKNQVFRQIYSQFQVEHKINFSEDMWKKITFSKDDQTTTTNFFELYQEELGSQGY
ncbi:MAG: peptidyl-prolyl cis-trans isomerase [Hungatella sp.]